MCFGVTLPERRCKLVKLKIGLKSNNLFDFTRNRWYIMRDV